MNPIIKRSLIMDPINPRDYLALKLIYYCEQCSHFDSENKACTIGYDASKHVKAAQDDAYFRTGKVAYCRFCEID